MTRTSTAAWADAMARAKRNAAKRAHYARDRAAHLRAIVLAGRGVCRGPSCRNPLARSNTSGFCQRCVTAERQRAHWQARAATFARTRDAARSA